MECYYIEDNNKTTCSHFIVGALVFYQFCFLQIVLEYAAPIVND